jgi:hypothetical protein
MIVKVHNIDLTGAFGTRNHKLRNKNLYKLFPYQIHMQVFTAR